VIPRTPHTRHIGCQRAELQTSAVSRQTSVADV
jgi:hypothetical protein